MHFWKFQNLRIYEIKYKIFKVRRSFATNETNCDSEFLSLSSKSVVIGSVTHLAVSLLKCSPIVAISTLLNAILQRVRRFFPSANARRTFFEGRRDNNDSRFALFEVEGRSLHFYEILHPFLLSTVHHSISFPLASPPLHLRQVTEVAPPIFTCSQRGRVLFSASSWNSCATIYTKSISRLFRDTFVADCTSPHVPHCAHGFPNCGGRRRPTR